MSRQEGNVGEPKHRLPEAIYISTGQIMLNNGNFLPSNRPVGLVDLAT